MATMSRNGSIGIFFGILTCTCAWAAPEDWTRVATEHSIAADSSERRHVREWLASHAAPGPGTLGALRVRVTRVFPGQSLDLALEEIEPSPGLFPPTADDNEVRILSCSSDVRTEWNWRAKNGQWILQSYDTRYVPASNVPCDVTRPLAETGA